MSQYKTTRSEMMRLIERLYREHHQHLPQNFVPTTAFYMTPIRENEALLYKTCQYSAKNNLNTDAVRILVRELHKALIQGSSPEEVFKTFTVPKRHQQKAQQKDAPRGAFDFYKRVLNQLEGFELRIKHLEDLYNRGETNHEITHEKLNRLHQKLSALLPITQPDRNEIVVSDIHDSDSKDEGADSIPLSL